MLPALSLLLFSPSARFQMAGHELEDFQGDPGISVKIDGKSRKLVLAPRWPQSYLVGADTAVHSITLGGKPFLQQKFEKIGRDGVMPGADGVLGADALKKMCLVFDPLWQRMEVLPAPKIGLEAAKAYFAKLPAWGAPKVVRIPLSRSIKGVPTIKTTISGMTNVLLMTVSTYNNRFSPRAKGVSASKGEGWSYLSGMSFPGVASNWSTYSTYDGWDDRDEGGYGMLSLDVFASRRVIVDFAADALYIEELSPDARLSLFLSDRATTPIVIEGETMKLAPIPGYFESVAEEMAGSTIRRIAGEPVAEWLKDLRSGSAEAVARMTARFRKIDQDYEIDLVDPQGEERTITIPAGEPASDTRSR